MSHRSASTHCGTSFLGLLTRVLTAGPLVGQAFLLDGCIKRWNDDAKQPKGELVVVGFDDSPLEAKVAEAPPPPTGWPSPRRSGRKTKMIADLAIRPTAAYLLAAPPAPDEARRTAIERADVEEQITTAVAREILAETRKKRPRRSKAIPADKLGGGW
jgi:hypothetical protein